jgi:hypothetical protein
VVRDLIGKSHVLEHRPYTNIVRNERVASSSVGLVGNDTDVRQVTGQHPGDEAPWQVVLHCARYWQ